VVKLLVVLLLIAAIAYRLRPHRRMTWMVPLVVVGVVLTVRTVTYLTGD
jgi:hypothetical protein